MLMIMTVMHMVRMMMVTVAVVITRGDGVINDGDYNK